MSRLRALALPLVCLLAITPARATAAVGMLRSPVPVVADQVGQIAPAAGLEFLGNNAAGLAGVYSSSTGALLAPLVAPFEIHLPQYVLQDFDGDGFEEVLCMDASGVTTTVGVERYTSGVMALTFPPIGLPVGVQFVGTMRLNTSNPTAMVFVAGNRVYIVRQNGVIRYDSTTDPAWPGGANAIATVQIADFIASGFEQLLVTVRPASGPGLSYNVLVGDPVPTNSITNESGSMQSMLQPSRPNPAVGPLRIGFQLPAQAQVQLSVFDAQGRLVKQLASGRMEAGQHEQTWDGRDLSGSRVPAGAYFYELAVDGAKETRKLIQLK